MRLRAVIFDVYGTLLEVGPPPANADARWESLWQDQFRSSTRLSLAEFAARCDQIIAREHVAARALGIPYPEVFWPDVATEMIPELAALSAAARDDFLFEQAQLCHTVRLSAGVADALRAAHDRGLLLGIASNAQAYTLRELDEALAGTGLSRAIFRPTLCFWSFEHGFSKPDPHVFRLLTARLRALGIKPNETLLVGDRLDHDIEPARAHGWHTWHLQPNADSEEAGDWQSLRRRLELS